MYIVKRDGRQEAVHFDNITAGEAQLKKLSGYGLSSDHCDTVLVALKGCAGVDYKGVTASQLDLFNRVCARNCTRHYKESKLPFAAAQIGKAFQEIGHFPLLKKKLALPSKKGQKDDE